LTERDPTNEAWYDAEPARLTVGPVEPLAAWIQIAD